MAHVIFLFFYESINEERWRKWSKYFADQVVSQVDKPVYG